MSRSQKVEQTPTLERCHCPLCPDFLRHVFYHTLGEKWGRQEKQRADFLLLFFFRLPWYRNMRLCLPSSDPHTSASSDANFRASYLAGRGLQADRSLHLYCSGGTRHPGRGRTESRRDMSSQAAPDRRVTLNTLDFR